MSLSIASFVETAVAVLFIPIRFGVLAIIAAAIGVDRKKWLAKSPSTWQFSRRL